MSEKDKLHSGEIYNSADGSIFDEQLMLLNRLYDFNQTRPIEQEKRFKTDKYGYEITTGDYDYANSIKVEIIERSEISNGNNPDAEAETIETWYADGKPALRCAYSVILDGPYHPEIVEVLDKNALYNILISLATQSQIFDNPIK